ncbi:MAG: alpha/beta hydrolase [Cytophagales bacterium]|nr:alpha/beta hydrolase [Cytophagales bacterium]
MKNTLVAFLLLLASSSLFSQNQPPFQVAVTGSGQQSILFLPGYSCSADVWKETIAQLGKTHRCHTFTFAGFAGVAPQPNPTMHEWAKSIVQYVVTQKLEKPIIVGHSLGGVLALWIAAENPDKIGKIVVVDALPCLTALFNPNFKSQPTPDCAAMVGQFEKMDAETFRANQYQNVRMLVTDTAKAGTVAQWGLRSDRATLGKMYCDFANTDLREKIASVQCPALILLEANFKNYGTSMTEQYKNLKTAQIVYADKGLHFIMYDDPEWYMAQLQPFVK